MGLQYEPEVISPMGRRARLFLSIAGVALVTFAARYVASVNANTAGIRIKLVRPVWSS